MNPNWRQIQKKNFTSLPPLLEFLQWPEQEREVLLDRPPFPLNLPLRLAQKAKTPSLEDPILKQFIPSKKELFSSKGFSLDPVQDSLFRKGETKMLHKYRGRALLVTTSACTMNCRFCFRKNFDYPRQSASFAKEIELIENDTSLKEIILSGGDPLSLSDTTLESLLFSLCKIPHIERIRFHSRFPLGIPERIDDAFLSLCEKLSKQIIFCLHVNHPKEMDACVFTAMKALQKLGIPVLSQSVLLKGVNDTTEVLQELFESLAAGGIIPYYLHQLDPVEGAEHFEVSEERGKHLMKELSTLLSGYCLPKYAKEIAGSTSKTPIPYS